MMTAKIYRVTIESVGLRKCPHDHEQQSDITIANIFSQHGGEIQLA